jgi:hypothetical protein
VTDSQAKIAAKCDALKAFLLRKNEAYGDAALNPARIMSKASADEQILVRIDDKLNRLRQGKELPDESFNDTVRDLAGYLVLLMVARGIEVEP